MATATTPSLGGTNLPMPASQEYERLYRGGTQQMADGSIVHDLVDTTARHRFRLKWILLTQTQKNSVLTAYDGVKGSTATYVDIENVSRTVTRPADGTAKVTPRIVSGADIKFDVELELLEDS